MRSARHFGRAGRAQRGVALLLAILIVALGTIIAATVAYENAMTARRSTATFTFDQALLVEEAAEAFAASGLQLIRQNDPQHIYLGQGWDKPQKLEIVPGVVMLEASLEDLQGRFNLNNLVRSDGTPDPAQVQAFTNLLEMLGLETKWAGYMVDWIDMDLVPSNPDGAEDSVYMGQTPPYRTANRYITSATELLALPGFGYDRYVKLAPYVTALPNNTALNVCTASGLVLDAYLGSGHSEFGANPDTLASNRQNSTGCFPTLQSYTAAMTTAPAAPQTPQQASPGNSQQNAQQQHAALFQMNSSYFRLKSYITIGSTEFSLYSLLYQDGTGMTRPILRSYTED